MLTYRHIIVGADLAAASTPSMQAAVRSADRFESQRVHLVHVVNTSGVFPPPLLPDRGEAAAAEDRALEKMQALKLPDIGAQVNFEVRSGSPARELSRAADEHHADLAVVARRGHNALTRLVLGSVPNTLTRICNCPVLVLDDDPPETLQFRRVLAVVDLSPVSRLVIDNALTVAKAFGGAVEVLSLFERPLTGPEGVLAGSAGAIDRALNSHQDALDLLLRRAGAQRVAPIEGQVAQAMGPVPPGIIEWAKAGPADLIVMGTSGRNAWHRMILGSTANHVLLRAPCPVLVVPPAVREEATEGQLAGISAFGG